MACKATISLLSESQEGTIGDDWRYSLEAKIFGAGASHVQLIRPAGVPVQVHIGAGASKLAIDDFRGSGRIDWRSPDYDQLEGRYDVEIGAGASNLTVRT